MTKSANTLDKMTTADQKLRSGFPFVLAASM
jgi:hypothetical protein